MFFYIFTCFFIFFFRRLAAIKHFLLYRTDVRIRACAIAQAPNWDNFQTLTSSSSVTTRQCSNEFSIALAAPSIPRR